MIKKNYLTPDIEIIDFKLDKDIACTHGSGVDHDWSRQDDYWKDHSHHHWFW